MPSIKKIIIIATLLTLTVVVSIARMRHAKLPPPAYTAALPIKRDMCQYISASGTIKAREQITVGSLISGKVEHILADDNDPVTKGQVLAVLDNGVGDSAVKQAAAELEQARINDEYQEKFYARQEALYHSGQIAQNLFDQVKQQRDLARAKCAQAAAALEIEQKRYDNLFIKSPDDGIVIARKIERGQMITSQLDAKVLYEIAKDLSEIEVFIDIDEADIGMVKEGAEASFSVDAYPKKIFKGHLRQLQFLAKIVDSAVTYSAVMRADNPSLKLRPGMTASVDIKVGEKTQALCVPNRALRINGLKLAKYAASRGIVCTAKEKTKKGSKGNEALWILDGTSLKQIPVKFGLRDGGFTEIVAGLEPDQLVITSFNDAEAPSFLNAFFSKSSSLGGGNK